MMDESKCFSKLTKKNEGREGIRRVEVRDQENPLPHFSKVASGTNNDKAEA